MDIVLLIAVVAIASFSLGRKSRNREATAPTLQDPPIETLTNDDAPKDTTTALALRVFQLIFMVGWLGCWTIGVLTVLGLLIGGEGNLFMLFWFIAAMGGWFMGAYAIYCLVTGRPLHQGLGRKR